jgi:hypothetical protein
MMASKVAVVLAAAALALAASSCRVRPVEKPGPAAPPPASTPAPAPAAMPAPPPAPCDPPYAFTPEDDQFLDELERRIVDYFWNEVFPETGIAVDHTQNRIGKVAATGFELAALCIGVERGWLTHEQGYERTWQILNAFWDDPEDPGDGYVDGQFGLFWHYVDGKTGRMKPVDCVAACDSADFIAGAIIAGEYFKGSPVETLARRIYNDVAWDQFVARNPDGSPNLMSFGWVPPHVSESFPDTDGLLGFNMGGFADNSLLIYVLALGSDTRPIPQATWEQYVDSYAPGEYAGYECIAAGQLFCRQVPAAFVPFGRLRDRKIDYFQDTVYAVLADRAFNMKENGYPPELWGLTDCFGKDSYSHSAPPGVIQNDGTVGTTAFAGALPHTPKLAMEAMRYVREKFGDRVWGKYGFASTVNPKNGYVSPLYVGIELGPMIQLIENARSGLIWKLFARSRAMKNFVKRAGICGVVDDFELPPESPAYASWSAVGGATQISSDQPQHGRRCLAVRTDSGRVQLMARLTQNDLLAYDFARYLSLWTRDLSPRRCTLSVDGAEEELAEAGRMPGRGWTHHYYRIPAHRSTSTVCQLVIEADVAGAGPALDNITFERAADLAAPETIADLEAATGPVGGAIELGWTAPADAGGGRVAVYQVKAGRKEDLSDARTFEFVAMKKAGEREAHTLLLDSGTTYHLAVAAVDEQGHSAPFSPVVRAQSNPEVFSPVAYDFENGSTKGWDKVNPAWSLSVVVLPGGGRGLRVEFVKNHPWNHLLAALDPQKVALHRYISMRVRGKVELLGKLGCEGSLEQDMEVCSSGSEQEWTRLRFDTHKAGLIVPGRDPVVRLILFPQPGQGSARGVFVLDDVTYSNE